MKLGSSLINVGGKWIEATDVEFHDGPIATAFPSPTTFNIPPVIFDNIEDDGAVVDKVCSLVASAVPGMEIPDASFALRVHASLYQDDDAHETCSLTACLDPLHPGPCKGWKGNLFKVAPNAYHALEAARVEKANAARLKKIQALKDAGKPIPKKLLVPIVAKPHPHAGKTANAATGEAHAAGQAVTESAGVHVQMPGKVTLGQAVKQFVPTDATPEKGPKGKKPTVASKGIAAVIAQEKVTPQYKLDKAAKITPEQWNALSADEKSIIRGELAKIQTEGFGPQQKKATELLDALPAQGLKGGGTDTVTTPKGQVVQKVTLKDTGKPEVKMAKEVGGPPTPPKTSAPSKPKLSPEAQAKIDAAIEAHKANPPKVQIAKEVTGPTSAAQANAIAEISNALPGVKSMPDGASEKLVQAFDKLKEKGDLGETLPFKKAVTALATSALKTASEDKVPGVGHGDNDIHNGTLHKEIAEHILAGKPGLPPMVAKIVAHHEATAQENVKEGIEQAAKAAHEAKVEAAKTGGPTMMTPSGLVKEIQKNGSATVTVGGITHKVAFENGPDDHAKLIQVTGIGSGTGHYVLKTPGGQSIQLGKGEQIAVHAPEAPVAAKLGELKPGTPGTVTTPSGKTYQKVELKPETPKIENAAPAAPKAPELPKHVQHAADMANHEAPGAGLSKNHLAAYQKLSAEEFHSLPEATQGKIIQELEKGKTKFLDPKKVAASQELINKFQADKTGAPGPKAAKIDFYSHLKDHSVSEQQAKEAAAGQAVSAHAAVAKNYVGLDPVDQPDILAHQFAAKAYGEDLLASFTKNEPPATLKDPAVQQATQDVLDAATKLKQTQLIGQAKKNAYNKIDMALKGDTGQLSPIQKASLAEYQKYLLAHPVNTEPEEIAKLFKGVLDATDALKEKLKAAKTPKPDEVSPAQLDSKIAEILGAEAVKPNVNLTMAELKEAHATGVKMAHLGTEKYSPATMENPTVAAKMKLVEQIAGQLAATSENSKKLQAHLKQYHYHALESHEAGVGHLNAPQLALVKAHAEKLKKEHAYLDEVTKKQQDLLTSARKDFDKAASEVQDTPSAPVTLSDYDQQVITEAYGNNWGKQASKAVLYGVKTWSQKSEMKDHNEYPSFTQDLGNLQQAVKNLALAHAAEHVADLNVPTDPDTGAKLEGPEKTAWLKASVARMKAEQDYNQLYKVAQMRLDKIRTDVGLKKRALPKIDSPALKAAAAESAYYKTAAYSGPNYGKHAAAKSYTLAKVGPKLGIKHQTAAEKKAEKATADVEKLKAAHPDFYAKKEAEKVKPKASGPSVAEAGASPNKEAAEKFGWKFAPTTVESLGGWPGSSKPAYINDEAQHKVVQDLLSTPDTKHGIEAQKQFKWSINNMQGKGASASQRNALYSYTGSGYDSVNTKLNSLPPGVEKTGSQTISNIDAAMAASPPMEADAVLYRGFKDPKSVFSSGKWNDTNVAGMEWSQRSYSSTSGALSTAQSFAGHGGVVMRVIIPKGMKVHGINAKGGQHGGENEIILQRGLRYRVVADYGKHGSDGKRYIDVMVVPSPYAKSE